VGVDRNERLTAVTGAVLIVLLAALGVTILAIGPLIWWHVLIVMLLIPPVLLKLGSTGWRFVGPLVRPPPGRRRQLVREQCVRPRFMIRSTRAGVALAGISCVLALTACGARSPKVRALPAAALNGVTCVSAGDCWAVGYSYRGAQQGKPPSVALHWDGRTWSRVRTPKGILQSVACETSRDCWAVGSRFLHWDGRRWSIVRVKDPDMLLSVTCVRNGGCWAVGSSPTNVFHWDGTNWVAVRTPQPAAHGGIIDPNVLYGVSCSSARSCLAVGTYGRYSPSGNVQYYSETLVWNGRVWSAANASAPSLQHMFSVACTTSSDCWGVGSAPDTLAAADFAKHWNGSTWTSVALPVARGQELPQTVQVAGLVSVTCSSPADCWTVGSSALSRTQGYGTVVNEALHWNGSTWRLVNTPNPDVRSGPARAQQFLSAVYCTATTNCWAVGHYSTFDLKSRGVEIPHVQILHWDGKRWTRTRMSS